MFAIFPEIKSFENALGWTLSAASSRWWRSRAVDVEPKLLLLDEPSLGLAPIIVQQVYRVIADIRRQGTTVLLVEQNAHMALSVADHGYVLEDGPARHCGQARSAVGQRGCQDRLSGRKADVVTETLLTRHGRACPATTSTAMTMWIDHTQRSLV